MLVEKALHKILSEDAGVSAFVANRITAPVLPQTVIYPAIAFRLLDRNREAVLDGSTGLAESQFLIFCCGHTTGSYLEAKLLDEAVRLCLQGFSGEVTDETLSPVESVFIQNILPLRIANPDRYDDPTQTVQIVSLFQVFHSEQTTP